MDGRDCQNEVLSEDYLDYLIEYFSVGSFPVNEEEVCYNIASNRFAVIYEEGREYTGCDGVKIIPRCYGLVSSDQVLEVTGVSRVQRQPRLSLYGRGVMVGFVDTGECVIILSG